MGQFLQIGLVSKTGETSPREIRSLADRILVMFDGVIVGEADPATATEGELGLMMAGIGKDPPRGLGIAEQGPLP